MSQPSWSLLAFALLPQAVAGRQASSSMRIRYYFAQTSLRMIASSPVFGVGVTRYVSRSPQFMPPVLKKYYPRENAHNQFLQVTAELGVVGGALFALVALVPFVRGLRVLRRLPSDPELLGVVGGLSAFLITCLSGHPLLYSQVAFPFWILVGMASGMALRARNLVTNATDKVAIPQPLHRHCDLGRRDDWRAPADIDSDQSDNRYPKHQLLARGVRISRLGNG